MNVTLNLSVHKITKVDYQNETMDIIYLFIFLSKNQINTYEMKVNHENKTVKFALTGVQYRKYMNQEN